MTTNLHSSQKDQREENHNLFVEVSKKEKHLVMLIHTQGLLNSDVQELYRKVRFGYEKIILNDNEQSELQDIEYCLWKLHYKHIDEFRKRINNTCPSQSTKPVEQRNNNHLERFKLFLAEATEFYQNLIVKIRKCYRLPGERVYICRTSESKKTKTCQFLCHRFLVCLGDLARYREQYENPDVKNHKWSMAATHYMEATAIWPDSGNPQNQLAVLATYVGDEFLALYHCIRSLAVKEPFPDAHDNLIVLLERNRLSVSMSRSSEAQFNFLKPSERCIAMETSKSSGEISLGNGARDENSCATGTDVWSLFIKMISFFFIKSSFDDFPFAFTSIMRELDALMELDDKELKASLESYNNMDSVKKGPFRALQVVSIFLYTLENLINIPQTKDSEDAYGTQLVAHRNWALLSTFVFMGRFVDRCLKASSLSSCPLVPAVMVFVEWLVGMLKEAEKCVIDEKGRAAMSYFYFSFFDLSRRIGAVDISSGDSSTIPLWEDHELRGFAPVANTQRCLDFSSHWEHMDSFEDGFESRVQRLINAGQIICHQSRGKFYNPWVTEAKVPEKKAPNLTNTQIPKENPKTNGNIVTSEDEEVILFNPLTRFHSAPLCSSSNDRKPPKAIEGPPIPPENFLRHATSLLVAQNPAHASDPSASITNFGDYRPFEQQELVFKDAANSSQHSQPISAGPPSLSSWVINGGNLIIAKEKTPKHALDIINETAIKSLCSLSITETKDSIINVTSSYTALAPSAPLLPDDATWYGGLHPSPRNSKPSEPEISLVETENIANHIPNWTPALSSVPTPTLILPTQRQMTSSQWLRHYLQTQYNLADRSYNSHAAAPAWSGYYYTDAAPTDGSNSAASGATIQVDTPPLYAALPLDYGVGSDAFRRDKLLYGYQRPSPYVCGEPQPLLQYLKERERQLQALDPGATVMRGPTYMGN